MIKVITMGFVRADIFRKCLKRWQETRISAWEHHFYAQHYPMHAGKYGPGTKQANLDELREICVENGILWHDLGADLGFSEGFNRAVKSLDMEDNDIFIGIDPDEWPQTPGWDQALVQGFHPQAMGYLSMNNWYNLGTPDTTWKIIEHDGIRSALPLNKPVMCTIAAWSPKFLRDAGGMQQPTSHYGHIESHLWQCLRALGRHSGVLLDYKMGNECCGIPHDGDYVAYKQAQAGMMTRASFEEWLRARK